MDKFKSNNPSRFIEPISKNHLEKPNEKPKLAARASHTRISTWKKEFQTIFKAIKSAARKFGLVEQKRSRSDKIILQLINASLSTESVETSSGAYNLSISRNSAQKPLAPLAMRQSVQKQRPPFLADPKTGLTARVAFHPDSKEIIIIFGVMDGVNEKDLRNDFENYKKSKAPPSEIFRQAGEFVRLVANQYPGYQISTTGQSAAAFLAAQAADYVTYQTTPFKVIKAFPVTDSGAVFSQLTVREIAELVAKSVPNSSRALGILPDDFLRAKAPSAQAAHDPVTLISDFTVPKLIPIIQTILQDPKTSTQDAETLYTEIANTLIAALKNTPADPNLAAVAILFNSIRNRLYQQVLVLEDLSQQEINEKKAAIDQKLVHLFTFHSLGSALNQIDLKEIPEATRLALLMKIPEDASYYSIKGKQSANRNPIWKLYDAFIYLDASSRIKFSKIKTKPTSFTSKNFASPGHFVTYETAEDNERVTGRRKNSNADLRALLLKKAQADEENYSELHEDAQDISATQRDAVQRARLSAEILRQSSTYSAVEDEENSRFQEICTELDIDISTLSDELRKEIDDFTLSAMFDWERDYRFTLRKKYQANSTSAEINLLKAGTTTSGKTEASAEEKNAVADAFAKNLKKAFVSQRDEITRAINIQTSFIFAPDKQRSRIHKYCEENAIEYAALNAEERRDVALQANFDLRICAENEINPKDFTPEQIEWIRTRTSEIANQWKSDYLAGKRSLIAFGEEKNAVLNILPKVLDRVLKEALAASED